MAAATSNSRGISRPTSPALPCSSTGRQIKGTVSEVSGTFFTSIIAVGDVLESDVEDNGPRSSGVPDRIEPVNQPKDTGFVCAADGSPYFPVENGRITIHQ